MCVWPPGHQTQAVRGQEQIAPGQEREWDLGYRPEDGLDLRALQPLFDGPRTNRLLHNR